jgi:hypothetical protein
MHTTHARLLSATMGALALWVLGGCARELLYPGPQMAREDVARIIGDPKINAGLPMAAVLREVDDHVIGWNVNTVEVMPGAHRVLVDCVVGSQTVRFAINVNAIAGYRYQTHAEPEIGNRSCANVTLVESR